jgi:hypothetical protein
MSQPAQPTTTTQIQKTELPAWVDNASQGNYAFAEQVANRPFQQYQGQTVAGLSQGEKDASGILANGMSGSSALQDAAASLMGRAGTYQPGTVSSGGYLGVGAPRGVAAVNPVAGASAVQGGQGYMGVGPVAAAGDVAQSGGVGQVQGGQGYQQIAAPNAVGAIGAPTGVANVQGGQGFLAVNQPQAVRDVASAAGATPIGPVQGVKDVASTRFNGADLKSYLDPFTNNVVDTTLGGMRDNLALSSQKADDAAMGSGAWGSSRSGVMQAVLQSQGAKDMASTEAGLRSAAYTDAAGRLTNDNNSALQAALANQQSGLTTQGRQLTADQSNQSSTLQTQGLNANIAQGNQNSALQTEAQRLQAGTTNASNFLANAGQKLQGDISNQNSALTTQNLGVDVAKANQSSALQTEAQRLAAGTSNASNFLTNAGQKLQGDVANQNSALATEQLNAGIRQGNQASTNTNNALNASVAQGNQSSFLANAGQKLQGDLANQASTNTNNALNTNIAQGNQTSALQTAQQQLSAALGNQGAFTAAAGQSLDAQKSNQASGLAAANLGLQSGTALGGLASDVTNNAGKNALLSAQLGSNDRAVEQANLDANAAKWQEQYDAPLTALNTRLAALGMSPYGKTTNTQETKTGGTSSNGLLTGLGAIASFLPLMFSDERLKKNVRTEGTTEAGVPLKSYEYKGFMGREQPGRHIGVMAQDMEKKDPGAVHRVKAKDGKTYRAVDYSRVGRGFMGRAA